MKGPPWSTSADPATHLRSLFLLIVALAGHVLSTPAASAQVATLEERARVAELFRLVMANEFKRYQYAPTLRVSDRCWTGRRLPVTHRYRER